MLLRNVSLSAAGSNTGITEATAEVDAFCTNGSSPPHGYQATPRHVLVAEAKEGDEQHARERERPETKDATLTEFLGVFFPDEDETICLRAFVPKGAPSSPLRKLTASRRELRTDKDLQRQLKELNKSHGLYFAVNSGGDNDASITRYNAFFAESDDRPIDEQHRLLDEAPIPPSIRVVTKKSVHAYWPLDGECGELEWRDIQARLIAHLGSDPQIKNPSRVMRLPHFDHLDGNLQRKRVEIVVFEPERSHTAEAMREAFPAVQSAKPASAATASAAPREARMYESWEALNAAAVREISALESWRVSGDWGHARGVCHNGQGDSALAVNLTSGAYHCKAECETGAILRALGLPEKPSAPDAEGADALVPSSSWPAPLAEAAFHGLAGEVVRAIEPHSEADPAALLFQFLAMAGNVIGRGASLISGGRHHTNLFVGIVGTTSKGRKGTSLAPLKELLRRVDEDWTQERIVSGLSSGEGVIWNVRDPIEKQQPIRERGRVIDYQMVIDDPGIEDKRLFVVEEELATPLHAMRREGSTLSPVLRCGWDSGDLRVTTKNNPAKATGAHISIIGHITKDELDRVLGEVEVSNGLANRFLWVMAKRSKCLPRGGWPPSDVLEQLAWKLRAAVQRAQAATEMNSDPEAEQRWDEIYSELSDGQPGRLGKATARSEALVTRIAMIYALLDGEDTIRRPHLEAALAVWRYAEDSARYIFGDSLGDPLTDELLAALRAAPEGLHDAEINNVFGRNKSAENLRRAKARLLEAGLVRQVKEGTGGRGRPPMRWLAVNPPSPHQSDEINEKNQHPDSKGGILSFNSCSRHGEDEEIAA